MDLRHFVTFKTIVESGSFTAAGRELGYTQSAITAHVRQLEKSLGLKLFDHIGRSMVLTQAGYDLLEHTDELLLVLEKVRSVGDMLGDLHGTLRIAIPADLALSRLCWALKKYQDEAPHVDVIVSNNHSIHIIHQMLQAGYVDVAFTVDYGWEDLNLEVVRLEVSRLCLIAGPTVDHSKINLTRRGEPLGCGIVLNQKDSAFRGIFEDYLKSREIAPANITELWGIEVIKRFVHFGAAITLLPHVAIEGELDRGELVELVPEHPMPEIYINMTVLRNKWESPQLRLFKQVVREHFVSQYPALEEVSRLAKKRRA